MGTDNKADSIFAKDSRRRRSLKFFGTMNEKKADPKTDKITVCYSDSVWTATKLRLIRIFKRLSWIYLFLDHRTEIFYFYLLSTQSTIAAWSFILTGFFSSAEIWWSLPLLHHKTNFSVLALKAMKLLLKIKFYCLLILLCFLHQEVAGRFFIFVWISLIWGWTMWGRRPAI